MSRAFMINEIGASVSKSLSLRDKALPFVEGVYCAFRNMDAKTSSPYHWGDANAMFSRGFAAYKKVLNGRESEQPSRPTLKVVETGHKTLTPPINGVRFAQADFVMEYAGGECVKSRGQVIYFNTEPRGAV